MYKISEMTQNNNLQSVNSGLGELCIDTSLGSWAFNAVLSSIAVIVYAFIFTLFMAASVQAGIVPTSPPVDTTLGGTGAAMHSLSQVAAIPGKIKILQNLSGPNFGAGRERQFVHIVPMTQKHLPGVEDYFMRSSYVVLSPRGFAPIHSHVRRPAYLQAVSGAITQHRSDGLSLTMGYGDFTFSSDELAHWWINESDDTAIRLWIVELCNVDHGCKQAVDEGGALVLDQSSKPKRSKGKAISPETKTLMSIDLAGEFKDAPKLGSRELRLRRIEIAPGAVVAKADLGAQPTFFRIDSGELIMTDSKGTHAFPTHTIVYADSAPNGPHWRNPGTDAAVLYVVDLVDP